MWDSSQIERYRSQLMLREIGELGQRALSQASVLIIGAGGLGCPAALYLGGCGVGRISIMDGDTVELGNLHRQVAYTMGDIGEGKAAVLARAVSARNPEVEAEAMPIWLNRFNAAEAIARHDIVLDGCDNFATRMLVANEAAAQNKPYIFGAASGFAGQVSVFAPYRNDCDGTPAPRLQCFIGDEVSDQQEAPCASGVIAPAVGVIGLMQAMEAVKLVTGIGEPLIGWLLVFDFLAGTQRKLRLRRDNHLRREDSAADIAT